MKKFLDIISQTKVPNTKDSILQNLQELSIQEGDTLIVHSSLSKIGYCIGGEHDVIAALLVCVGEKGNIVMPAHSSVLTEPSAWENPPVPEEWHSLIRKNAPAFNTKTTRTSGMGRIAETFRHYPNVFRSNHPVVSFCAWGQNAQHITENHSLSFSLGKNSPLGKLYQMNTKILMLGTHYSTNTSIHLAESLSGCRKNIKQGSPIMENGKRVWKIYDDLDYDSEDFQKIGLAYEEHFYQLKHNAKKNRNSNENIIKGKIGYADCVVINQKYLIDFATDFFFKLPAKAHKN